MKSTNVYDKSNLEAATVILSDTAKHGGEDSLMVRWARAWMERHGERQPLEGGQLALFETRREKDGRKPNVIDDLGFAGPENEGNPPRVFVLRVEPTLQEVTG